MTNQDLINLRIKLGISQAKLGRLMGYGAPQQRVSEIERGIMPISTRTETVCKMIELLYDRDGTLDGLTTKR